MARQLQAEGQQVGLLALFDTFPTSKGVPRLARLLKFLKLPLSQKLEYVPWKVQEVKGRIERWTLPSTLKAVRDAHRTAASRYVMRRYDGRITLFSPFGRSLKDSDHRRAAWSHFANDVEIQEVTGDHRSMLGEPGVRTVAERLALCLERAYSGDLIASAASNLSARI
jgi:thioesterase domain-containing protein